MSHDGKMNVLHSMESVNFLKVDKSNLIEFDFATENKVIKIR
jgi:hypothetical protein